MIKEKKAVKIDRIIKSVFISDALSRADTQILSHLGGIADIARHSAGIIDD